MAALLIVGGLALADKIDRRKQRKKDKKLHDKLRYKELQAETIARSSGRKDSAVDGSESGSEAEGEHRQRAPKHISRAPPSYDEAVRTTSRPG